MSEASAPRTTNVQVAVRCRPINAEERKSGQSIVVQCEQENKLVKVAYGTGSKKVTKSYNFDRVFGMYSTQDEVFQSMVTPIVDEVLAGFNCTIFAYGQTGTGKTHTMEGEIDNKENSGIVPRSVRAIFENLDQAGIEFTVRVSFLELYNEELQDLLTDGSDKERRLRLCEDLRKGVVCQNLEEVTVLNVDHIFEILKKGIEQRQTAATLCNKNSSRSHSIFTMKILIKETSVDGEEVLRQGQMNLVDLAGSECVGRSGAKDQRAREAGSINQSLLTLGRVITALVDHHQHIPYRDSKLTRLLQESLGGKTKTCIIATMSPSIAAVEETLSTLDYAYRAKSIKNAPQINQKTSKKVLLKEYGAEIENLRQQLQMTREKNGIYLDPIEYEEMQARLSAQEIQLVECESALKSRTEEMKTLREERDEMEIQLQTTTKQLVDTTTELESTKEYVAKLLLELDETRLELRATQAVVQEQVETEKNLVQQCSDLQVEVTNRRHEIDLLLGKVDRHVQNENIRIEKTGSFLTVLEGNRSNLLDTVNVMSSTSTTHSTLLCEGVEKMIFRGQDTCEVLQKAINQALGVLMDDATVAKNNMIGSCTDLIGHLNGTNNQLSEILKGMQGELSAWLGQLDISLKESKSLLQEQEKQFAKLSEEISKQAEAYATTSKSLLEDNIQASQEAQKVTQRLQAELQFCIEEYSNQHRDMIDSASRAAKEKTLQYEQAISTMLHDLLSMQTSSLESSRDLSSKFITSMTSRTSATTETHLKSYQGLEKSTRNASEKLSSMVHASHEDYLGQVYNTDVTRAKTYQALDEISNEVLNQQRRLDGTVVSVIGKMDKAIAHGCDVVQKTSQTAESILTDVAKASETMSDSTKQATESLNNYLNDEGKEISKKLGEHFEFVDMKLNEQKKVLVEIGEDSESFNQTNTSSAVRPQGTTPRKQTFMPLLDIKGTRDHNTIKSEAKKGKSLLNCSELPSSKSVIVDFDAYTENQDPQSGKVTAKFN